MPFPPELVDAAWVKAWAQGVKGTKRKRHHPPDASPRNIPGSFSNAASSLQYDTPSFNHGPLPEYLCGTNEDFLTGPSEGRPSVKNRLDAARVMAWQGGALERLMGALKAIPASIGYDRWYQIGMALKDLGWEDASGEDLGLLLWDRWSASCPEKYPGPEHLAAKWESFNNNKDEGVTAGSIYYWAREHGWNGVSCSRPLGLSKCETVNYNQINGVDTMNFLVPAAITANPIVFPDRDRYGNPKPSYSNARIALQAFAISCKYDAFANRYLVGGQQLNDWQGELSDNAMLILRTMTRERFGFDPGSIHMRDATIQECLINRYNPVLDYLGGLQWDGVPRLQTWLHSYMGAENTPANAIIGGLMLVAAIRRARQPGCKYDLVVVLEGVEGIGKSTALAILAGAEHFSDQEVLTLSEHRQQEALEGIWMFELPELAGMRRAEVEKVKAFVSRTTDRARPAYGHFRIDRARTNIFVGTTNDRQYLLSQTGNRRFPPVLCGRVALKALERDRDQLWAQAAHIEATGVPLELPEAFWGAFGQLQEQRRVTDPWEEALADLHLDVRCKMQLPMPNDQKGGPVNKPYATIDGKWELRIGSYEILKNVLSLQEGQIDSVKGRRLATVMNKLGWVGPEPLWIKGRTIRAYRKLIKNDP